MTLRPASTPLSRILRHAPTAGLIAAAAVAFAAAGCTGLLGDPDASDLEDVPVGAGVGGDDGDDSDADGDGDDGPGPSPEFEPPAPVLRRLLSRHYVNAVRDVLGPAAAAVATPPSVGTKLNGFDSIAAATYSLTDAQVRAFEESARAVASEAMADEAIVARVRPCTPSGAEDEACMRTVVETHGRRAFRRSLTADEVAAYLGLGMAAASEYGDFQAGVEYVVATTLQSPHFLYVVEIGEPIEGEDLRLLSGPEIATRLSFFLADTTPTDALLDAAEAGELDDAAGVRAWAEQLVAEPGAKASVSAAIEEVMRYSEFEQTAKDGDLFPGYDDALEASMREETRRFVEAIFDEGGGLEELLASPDTFVDASLAELYGVDVDLAPGEWQRVTLPEEQGRAGLLGHAGFLAINAFAERTSPTRRGKVVLESFICYPPLSPPPGVETELPPEGDAKTLRQRLEQHMTDPSCSGCHTLLDGIGFGLEGYDAVGRFRTIENGEPVDADSEIPEELPGLDGFTGGPFNGAREAGEILAAQPAVRDCLVRNFFRAGLGHIEEEGEEVVIAEVSERFVEEDLSLPELLVELAASDGFRMVGGAE